MYDVKSSTHYVFKVLYIETKPKQHQNLEKFCGAVCLFLVHIFFPSG